jgi:hypothetical protein
MMMAQPGQHGGEETSSNTKHRLNGRYWASVWGIDCILELHLDDTGRLNGSFEADGDPLEVNGETEDVSGACHGVIRAHGLSEHFAEFRAEPAEDGLMLEVHLTNTDGNLEHEGQVMFTRLAQG